MTYDPGLSHYVHKVARERAVFGLKVEQDDPLLAGVAQCGSATLERDRWFGRSDLERTARPTCYEDVGTSKTEAQDPMYEGCVAAKGWKKKIRQELLIDFSRINSDLARQRTLYRRRPIWLPPSLPKAFTKGFSKGFLPPIFQGAIRPAQGCDARPAASTKQQGLPSRTPAQGCDGGTA